jgi:DNA-3-methyladenine glycosylase I
LRALKTIPFKKDRKAMRCGWCGEEPVYVNYHDDEWGVPIRNDHKLFECLLLECMQAGLSWITILKKRHHFSKAFAQFDPQKIARFDSAKIEVLLQNPGIVRNRLKVESSIINAQSFLGVAEQFGTFSNYLWAFVDQVPIRNQWLRGSEVPSTSVQSLALSKDLKQRGFKFVGPTIVYAYMQAVGMVNDHLVNCYRYNEV